MKRKDGNQQISWKEMKEQIKERQEDIVKLEFDLGNGMLAKFSVRGLTKQEWDQFERQISKEFEQDLKSRKVPEINMQDETPISLKAKEYYLMHGLVDYPDGFDPQSKEDRDQLPSNIVTELTNEIDNLTNLGIELKRKFR